MSETLEWRTPKASCHHNLMTEWFKAEWLKQYGTAMIALIGVFLGSLVTGVLTFLNGLVMRNRDLKLKLWERFLDHRIAAHETVVAIALKMRQMVPLALPSHF